MALATFQGVIEMTQSKVGVFTIDYTLFTKATPGHRAGRKDLKRPSAQAGRRGVQECGYRELRDDFKRNQIPKT